MEIWKDIKGYKGFYQVSSIGNVKSLERKIPNGSGRIGFRTMKSKELSPAKDSYGYFTVSLCKKGKSKTHRIHRLIYTSFVSEIPNNKVVDHINGNELDNSLENLQLLSHRQNVTKGTLFRSIYSKYPNVSFCKIRKKYFGRLQVKGKSVITGRFENDIDAYNSVLKYKTKHDIV